MAETIQFNEDLFNDSISLFAPQNFMPRGWFHCNGQSLKIEHFPELFKIIGIHFGGDGVTTFNLPDLTKEEEILKGVRFMIFCHNKNMEDCFTDYIGTVILSTETEETDKWKFCNGQELRIVMNQPLFSICGTSYGGKGLENFALPDLREAEAGKQGRYMICITGLFPVRD